MITGHKTQRFLKFSYSVFCLLLATLISSLSISSLCQAISGSSVTIIGDSITVGSSEAIDERLPGVEINAEVGRQFSTGISIARSITLRQIVVFALGTNSTALTSNQVEEAVSTIGSSHKIIFMTNYTTTNDYSNNNRLIKEAASKYSNVSYIDWAGAISSDPGAYLSGDGIHPNAAGRRTFATLIYNTVNNIESSSNNSSIGGFLDETTLDFFDQNGIYYYNPTGLSSSISCGNISGQNYAGATVFSTAEMAAIAANQPFYERAAAAYGFPWQILAVLHYKEHSLLRDNPANGQGAYQLYSYTRIPGTKQLDESKAFLPAGSISDDEFQRQTDIVAKLINDSYAWSGIDYTNPDHIKRLFFRYNGASQSYIQKAIDMGFSQEDAANGEGSIYVMNRYDAQRDPTSGSMNPIWAGRYVGDGVYESGSTTNRFGAFVVYQALGGGGICSAGLVSGGMTYDQAHAFVENYVNNFDAECYPNSDQCDIGSVEHGGNCVTFSSYFVGKYTTLGKTRLPNGKDVVGMLANLGLPTGTEPRPYAIFSTSNGDTWCDKAHTVKCGHTGVILGIDEAANEIYIGQMSYSKPRSWGLTAIKRNLSNYIGNGYTYAYTDSVLTMVGN